MKKSPMRTLSALIVGGAVASVALAGCVATPAAPDAGADDGKSSADAAAFVACLKAGGVEARVSDGGAVMVRDTAEAPTGEAPEDAPQEIGEGLLFSEFDQSGGWLAVEDSGYFADDAATRDAYESCEQKFPGFTQPEFTAPAGPSPEQLKEQLDAALAFARCGRDKGYTWLTDPKEDTGGAIVLPSSLDEQEFRSLIDECWDEKSKTPLSWSADGVLSFDLWAVIDSIPGLSGTGGVITQPVGPEGSEG